MFPDEFSLDKGEIVSTVLPSLVLPQRVDDYVETHFLHSWFCDPQLFESPKFSALDTTVPVFWEMSEDVLFTRSFCSRLQRQFMRRTGSMSMFWGTIINQSIHDLLKPIRHTLQLTTL